jgi:hypothetical protein
MFQVPRNRKFYKERKDNTITREGDVKLFISDMKVFSGLLNFLGMTMKKRVVVLYLR